MNRKISTEKNEDEEKFIHIELQKAMGEALKDYCKAAKLNSPEFDMGYIAGVREDLHKPLRAIYQTFFFAGMNFAINDKKSYKIKKLTAEELTTLRAKWVKDKKDRETGSDAMTHIG